MTQQNTELILNLQTFGFSEKESIVYVAILQLGKGTVSEISRKASINRTTGYDILNSLAEKGVVSVSGMEPKQEYVAEDPKTIRTYLEKKTKEVQNSIEKSEEVIPGLTLLHSRGKRPKIRFYEGLEGMEYVYEDTLTATEPIRAYASVEDVHKTLPHYFPNYYKRRAKKGIAIRAIFPETPAGIERKSFDEEEKRETLLIPSKDFYSSPEINIYDNKIMIASWRDKLGILIESEEIADVMKKIYELAWAEAKRLDQEVRNKKIIL